jgi:probable phosphoglycerate mutase
MAMAGGSSGAHEGIMVPSRFLYLVRHGDADSGGALTEAGRRQASAAGERLRNIRFSAIRHSPAQRAEETAELIADWLPGVPVGPSGLLGDYLPPVSGLPELPPLQALLDAGYSPDERAEGAELARAAIDRYARAAGQDDSELIVTHNFLIGWFVRHALDAPDWRWLGLNQCNGAVTVILYRTGLPASLICFNDTCHLPPPLRWTGFPAEFVPPLG